MFYHSLRALLILSCASPIMAFSAEKQKRELSVLTYDAFMATGGLGLEIVARFEKKCGCRVQVRAVAEAVQLVSRLELERSRQKPETQVVVGMDQILWTQVQSMALRWLPAQRFVYTVGEGFAPLDYGVQSFIFNPDWKGFRASSPSVPKKWKDLLDPRWRRALLLQDPRTSSPGLGFVLAARSVFGSKVSAFFGELRSQWLTLSSGWSGAYRLFLKGEGPLVWSYTTSQAYHLKKDPQSHFSALIFEEGNPVQVEGAMIIKDAVNDPETRELAQEFVSFLVSKEIQELVPTLHWMFPAVQGTLLPSEFKKLPSPTRSLMFKEKVQIQEVLREWEMSIR